MRRSFTSAVLFLIAIFGASAAAAVPLFAQSKANKKPVKKPVVKQSRTAEQQQPNPPPAAAAVDAEKIEPNRETTETKAPVKKNGRPETSSDSAQQQQESQKKNQSQKTTTVVNAAVSQKETDGFSYEFTQPDFVVSRILIEHDETGKGTITFEKRSSGDPIIDPVQLSAAALERIKNLFQTMNFLDSTEEYQSAVRQYGHLGTVKIRRKKDGRERTAQFNWTENADAKILADEYRRVANQYVWIFDINLSRENQPLEAPSLMEALASMLRRNEISDPPQMLALLKNLSNDERIPLIARNHATRIVKEIEKKAKAGK